MMLLTKSIAEMPMSVSKWLENGTSDGKNHTPQVSIWTVSCFVNEYTFFDYISTHSNIVQ